jgi:hypothetical protein
MTTAPTFDLTSAIIAYETGDMDNEADLIELFQHLVDTGLAWQLQGHYGRTATALLEAEYITYKRGN